MPHFKFLENMAETHDRSSIHNILKFLLLSFFSLAVTFFLN